jgi:hypothetical protein
MWQLVLNNKVIEAYDKKPKPLELLDYLADIMDVGVLIGRRQVVVNSDTYRLINDCNCS